MLKTKSVWMPSRQVIACRCRPSRLCGRPSPLRIHQAHSLIPNCSCSALTMPSRRLHSDIVRLKAAMDFAILFWFVTAGSTSQLHNCKQSGSSHRQQRYPACVQQRMSMSVKIRKGNAFAEGLQNGAQWHDFLSTSVQHCMCDDICKGLQKQARLGLR